MDMSTHILVERPVSEQRTGIDLIAEEILSAQGNVLRHKQEDIRF